jgi:hypothetical protein
MANWHFVFAYDRRATDWLAEQGYPHPLARPGNRLPTHEEVLQAWTALGLPTNAPLLVEGTDEYDSEEDCFQVRGDLVLELKLLRCLCENCGQLWVYPDCGSPAIVVDATMSPERIAAAWLETTAGEDSWAAFHDRVYRAKHGVAPRPCD